MGDRYCRSVNRWALACMTIAASAAVLTACGRSPSAGIDQRAFVMTGICPVGMPVGDGRTVARDSVDSENWG